MKKILLVIGILISTQNIFGQISEKLLAEDKAVIEVQQSFAIPGSQHPKLIAKEMKLREYIAKYSYLRNNSIRKPMAWDFEVGDTRSWWADYFTDNPPSIQYQVPSTCRAVGQYCYIFVEDAVWNVNIGQSTVDAIAAEFDNTIYPIDVGAFGNPPDFDNDDKIIILVLDIQDGWSGGSYVAGYFYSLNQVADTPGDDGSRSNEAEIFYMDCYPADAINDPEGVFGTTAHEFQHMIHWEHDKSEMTFVDEGLAEIASYICGYGLRSNGLYAQNPNRNLLSWDYDDTLPDYSRAAVWTLFLYEQFPIEILMDFVNNNHTDWEDIDTTIKGRDVSSGFWEVFENWLIANYANGFSADPRYSYQYSPLTTPAPAATFTKETGNDDFNITFSGDNNIEVKALKLGSLGIEDVSKDAQYSPTDFGNTYSELAFLVYNKDDTPPYQSAAYSYTIGGTAVSNAIEIAYDDGNPEGYLGFDSGDSLAVIFGGIPGATLDSIRVAFRRNGRIIMDINKYDGGTFLRGERLFATLVDSPDSTASVPYPIPYDNWMTIDLTSENINISNDFVVTFVVPSNPSEPAVMASKEPNGPFNSRTYTNDGGRIPTQWWQFYYDDDGDDNPDGYWSYLIRAYTTVGSVSGYVAPFGAEYIKFSTTLDIQESGIITIPKDFSLGTNYPNPFNPSTTFDFTTPNDGLVKFTVYDLLGQVIYSEKRNLFAGKYSFTWDGKNQLDQQVVSGIYFLKMEAEGFTQTRKMLMMK